MTLAELTDEQLQEMKRTVEDRRVLYRNKYPYVWQWFLNLNMYAGNQWIRWDPRLRNFTLPPDDPEKPRLVINRIEPTVRQAVGKLLRNRMRQVCPPDANSEEAVDAAKVRTRLLEHLWRETKTDEYMLTVATWGANTGNGFTRYTWDENLAGGQGDVRVDVISPFSLVVPTNCLTIEQMPWIMEVTTRPVAEVQEEYPDVEGIQADAAGNVFDQFDARVLDFTSAGAFMRNTYDVDTTGPDGQPVGGGQCVFVMYWERPTEKYPKGRLIIVAGGQVVYPRTKEDLEAGLSDHSPTLDLPYNHFRWRTTGFRFWEFGLTEMLVPLQRERNELVSRILYALRHTVSAAWLAPKGSVEKDGISAEAGAVTYYTPINGMKPEAVTPPAISPEFFTRVSAIDQEMADIAGLHPRPAPGIRAAAAFALQQEMDNTIAEPVVENLRTWLVRDAQLKLALARKHYKRGRTIRTVGDAMQWEVMEYDRARLGDGDAVEIQDSGKLAQDHIQRIDQVLKLVGAKDAKGEPIIDAYEARRLLDLENSENLDSQVKADVNRARWENSLLEEGKQVPVNRWDNHDVHLREHYTRMKRLDFDTLPPVAREQFMLHTQAHEAAKAGAQALAPQPGAPPQMPPQGVPGQPPGSQGPQGQPPLPPGAGPVPAGLQSSMTAVNNTVAQTNQ